MVNLDEAGLGDMGVVAHGVDVTSNTSHPITILFGCFKI